MPPQIAERNPAEIFSESELEKINKFRNGVENKPSFLKQLNFLRESGEMDDLVRLAQRKYPDVLDQTFFGEKEWQALTVLWLFDEETSDHSVNTFFIANSKISQNFFKGAIDPITGKSFEMEFYWESGTPEDPDNVSLEQISREQFLRAAILHDIGKVEVPHSVLTNHVGEMECASILLANKDVVKTKLSQKKLPFDESEIDTIENEEQLNEFLLKFQIRPQHITPIRLLLSPEECLEVDQFLKDNIPDLSLDNTLMDIMRIHASHSKVILNALGFPIEAELAGAHHYKSPERGEKFNQKIMLVIGGIRVSIDLAHIVHLSDVEQAMISERYYKKAASSVTALATLVGHAVNGLVQKEITYLWVADELWRKHLAHEDFIEKDGDEERLSKIKKFMLDFEKNRPAEIDWPDFSKLVF